MKTYSRVNIEIPQDRRVLFNKLKEEYNPDGSRLRDYQHHLTQTLVEFNNFCQLHDIEYSLAYGTMLGAVRHKGFIPWDDDADILMTRYNYDKLLSLAQGKYHSLNDKIGLAMGIRPSIWMAPYSYVDVFVVDASPDNMFVRSLKQLLIKLIYGVTKCRGRLDAHSRNGIKWYIFLPLAILAKREYWIRLRDKISKWKNDDIKLQHVQAYNNVWSYIPQRFSKVDMSGYVLMEFEGYWLPVFNGYSMLLTSSYGDYMNLPKQIHIHGLVDKFNIEK